MDPTTSKAPGYLVWLARALTYLVYAFVLFSLVILLLGFFLLLFGANPDAPFAEWAYRSLDRVMAPFRGLFEPVRLDGRSVLDVSILFAMIVYALVGLFSTASSSGSPPASTRSTAGRSCRDRPRWPDQDSSRSPSGTSRPWTSRWLGDLIMLSVLCVMPSSR